MQKADQDTKTLVKAIKKEIKLLRCFELVDRRKEALGDIADDIEEQGDKLTEGAVITLVGSTGAGKSTLINALAGRIVAKEGVDRPTTSAPKVYYPESQKSAVKELLERASFSSDLDPEMLVSYRPDKNALWSGQIFIDAPDLNSVQTEHREIVRRLAGVSDVLMVVFHRQSIVEEAATSFIDDFVSRRGVVFVLGRADEVADENRETLRNQAREFVKSRWSVEGDTGPLFVVSAKQAQTEAHGGFEFASLVAWLRRFHQTEIVEGVRRRNLQAGLDKLKNEVSTLRREITPRLDEAELAFGAALKNLQTRLSADFGRGLEARRIDVATLLLSAIGDRWNGPGGYISKAGQASLLGAGVGTLLARRTIIGGLAAFGAGAAIEKGAEYSMKRRLESPDELILSASEIQNVCESEVLPVKLRLMDLGEVDELTEAVKPGAIVGNVEFTARSVWTDAISRDVPESAERCSKGAMRALKFILDSPVYGIAIYALYRIFTQYWTIRPATFDFILNTFIIVAAYGFLLRTLLKLFANLRAKAVLRGVRDTFIAAIAQSHKRTHGDFIRESKRFRDSFDRLLSLCRADRAASVSDSQRSAPAENSAPEAASFQPH
ncbi:MAG: ATP-binding cassette domain-containing protein [Planctomycetes bacterium]|nr:ATP-binding cassette domain-containing protein [Planctomycetota bacterium]